ncbi:hypothetical protein M0R88_01230 [Halorussus gelatinilyticus]|uniref:DUF7344 domain-containing protein n=1 Tax=Halorussus gelatinilyticus TaxID=2937524 RepID=A0A8U0II09_9EURY|nr:hypothetical protein [Halorussus gelatinilyticus]UPW00740.1 hypothetical protein M0R88_01230 [Halorussus gelatinilyticus]
MADDSTDDPNDAEDSPDAGDSPDVENSPAAEDPDGAAESDEAAASALVDTVFGAISSDRRRYALYYLRNRGKTDVETLATVVAGWTSTLGDPTAVVTPDDRERVRIALHHTHLPRLEREGFVRYDRETGTVELADVPELLDTVLARSLDQRRRGVGPRATDDSDWNDSRTDDAP